MKFGRTVKFFRPGYLGVTVQAVMNQVRDVHTINIQLARPQGANKYDWKNAIGIQFNKNELPDICLVILKFKDKVDSGYHGDNNNKSFLLEHKDNCLHIEASGPGQRSYIDLTQSEQFWFGDLVIEQTMKNMGCKTTTDLMNLLTRIYK